jgi:hypothetical protein
MKLKKRNNFCKPNLTFTIKKNLALIFNLSKNHYKMLLTFHNVTWNFKMAGNIYY